MNKQKIAILVDSGVDVPKEFAEKHPIYIVPLKIIYGDKEYYDGVTITPDEVYSRLSKEFPSTSLPSPEEINKTLQQIKEDGYEKVLGVFISSGLSGTYNIMRICMEEFDGLDCYAVDSKNIAIAAGLNAIQAAVYIEQGMEWEELKQTVSQNLGKSKVFFSLATLEYLQKGGRIGLVASLLGTLIDLKPVISCNDDGVYYVAGKVRGRKQSIEKTKALVKKFGEGSLKYNLAVMHGGAKEEVEAFKKEVLELFPNPQVFVEGQISPVLGVHTGPGLVGAALQLLD